MSNSECLHGLSDIRAYMFRNELPIYYVDYVNFNLMGIDEWVRRFRYVNYNDCFAGAHPNVIVPARELSSVYPFERLETLNNYLLTRNEVREYITARGPGQAVFLYFDEETLDICDQLHLEVIFPPIELRRKIDSKVECTRMATAAGVASVPNAMGRVTSYESLQAVAGDLGPNVVVQAPFGDSGETTWFISGPADWGQHGQKIAAEHEVKVMKKIRCRQAAIEACVTRCGTIVGPLLTEVIGCPELTPYPGGWAGNEVSDDIFGADIRAQARYDTEKLGAQMAKMGYRGYFEVDYLFDVDTEKLYLGEINPRISGASSMTNLAAFAQADAPLFLFHLMEFRGVDFEFNVEEINRRWSDPKFIDAWGNLIVRHTDQETQVVHEAPQTGVWRMEPGGIEYVRSQTHRRTVDRDEEAFFLRIAAPGDVIGNGDEIGIIVMRGRLMDDEFRLTDRTRRWINEIRGQFTTRMLG